MKFDQPPNFRDEQGKLFVIRCPNCRQENYGPAVAGGQCAFCGWMETIGEDTLRFERGPK